MDVPVPYLSLIYIWLCPALRGHDALAACGRSCGCWRYLRLCVWTKTVGHVRIKGPY